MWYRSLYWRIGLGFVALLASLLLVQAVLVLWMTGQADNWFPIRSPFRLVTLVARDVSGALTQDPDLPLESYIRDEFAHIFQPFFIVMADGRVIHSREGRVPSGVVRAARERLGVPARFPTDAPPGGMPPRPPDDQQRSPGEPQRPLGGQSRSPDAAGPQLAGPQGLSRESEAQSQQQSADVARPSADVARPSAEPQRPGQERPRRSPGDGLLRPIEGRGPIDPLEESAPIVANGKTVGLVVVSMRGQPLLFVRQFGPTLAFIGLMLLVAGAAIGSLVIFGPARKRMRGLEQAAAALGSGRTSVRAPEEGDDEVSALARAFNRMASALESSDAARRRLLADVSHELRTPLTAIRGYIETLSMPEIDLDEATRTRYLRIVGDETHKLEAIVGDLLDLSRLESGGMPLERQQVAVAVLFERVKDRHEPALRDRQVTLETEIEPDAGEVMGDPRRLEQALQNLAANAVRHSPPGGRVSFRASRDGGKVRITVRDNGLGIPAEHLPHIFDRFYKVQASRTAGQSPAGSGLGLSIVKAIVEQHGGTVSASNHPDGGAVFQVVLPAPPVARS
ncbi:MAG: ATP-binding protein [Vicinamibacterales bacterium]